MKSFLVEFSDEFQMVLYWLVMVQNVFSDPNFQKSVQNRYFQNLLKSNPAESIDSTQRTPINLCAFQKEWAQN